MARQKNREVEAGVDVSTTTSRRGFLFIAGAASCVALSGGTAGVARALTPLARGQATRTTRAPFEAVRPGMQLHTSTLASVRPVRLGGVAVLLRRPDGTTFQVDVLRRSERDGSIAQSEHYSVFAVNGGTGSLATSEPDGLAAMAFARALRRAERHEAPVAELLTHAERARRYPAGTFRVAAE